jgi:ABC-type transport system involved in cytochrome c biogenesis ATPase subunit/GNAT superfamily N-acetyltransferase
MTRHHTEHFQINRYHRRYDRETDRFIINISYETHAPQPTQRVIAVAESFGLGLDQHHKFTIYDNVELKISPHDIVYITGESGSGKSALLRALENDIKNDMQLTTANINDIQPISDKPIIETVGNTTEQALELLSRVGLNDAFLFLRTYAQLSDGQKYRYRTAKLIETNAQFWILDEFAATLDRDTAKITAHNIQKLARQLGKAVIAATTHTDLHADLQPNVHIHKHYGKQLEINYNPNPQPQQCTLLQEIKIEPGTRHDYEKLAEFHYRSHNLGAVRKIFKATRNTDELCGVIVYTYPAIATTGRKLILHNITIRELNQKLSNIMRVVVHPKYRTIGLGQQLVRETLAQCGTPYVETTAVMARYNPFFEKAGMTQIHTTTPPKQAQTIRNTLAQLNFNTTLLNSEEYTLTQLKHLTQTQLAKLRETFAHNYHPRLAKEFFHDEPYGTLKKYREKLQSASPDKLAKLISVTALLLQTKIYLFWRQN